MRLDKFLSSMGAASRSEASKAARKGMITVNGVPAPSADVKIDPDKDIIEFCGKRIEYLKNVYIMLNKPAGYVSSTDEKDGKTVISLLPAELQKRDLFPCGRLDKDTEGLLLITNDGQTAHRLLSPSRHVPKVYLARTSYPLTEEQAEKLRNGVALDGGDVARPAKAEIKSRFEIYITIVEGMYHQIKRMLESVGNKVEYLERIKFGNIPLDQNLKRGQWRYLSEEETDTLISQTK